MKRVLVEKSTYLDSVSLMVVSKKASKARGIENAMVAMATDTNLALLGQAGFDRVGTAGATPNDLIIAIDAVDESSLESALAMIRQEIRGGALAAEEVRYKPHSLDGALKMRPDINLVFISVPGAFAAAEAQQALSAGRHVMIFSDNVAIEDEVRLKAFGRANGLLVMGPDCGTAIINGIGLGFANAVPRGNVGIVSASGTGAQEVSSVLARLGAGISQLIGTGGRDVTEAVGGITTLMGLEALAADESTRVIVIISKVPDEAVGRDILGMAEGSGKPCVVWFAGQGAGPGRGNLEFAGTLADAARRAAKEAKGAAFEAPVVEDGAGTRGGVGLKLPPERKFIRGLFGGGTLAQEALYLLKPAVGEINTNVDFPGTSRLKDVHSSSGHCIVDLGDDAFTRGRAHPMIDQSYKLTRMARDFEEEDTAVILMDVVLGYGCNPDPGGEIARVLSGLRKGKSGRGGPAVVVNLCGTYEDPQDYTRQKVMLQSAGTVVADTNESACRIAAGIIGH